MKNNQNRKAMISGILSFFLIFSFFDFSSGKLIGSPKKLIGILKPLIEPLDALGIDVIAGNSKRLRKFENRPWIANLSGFSNQSLEDIQKADWMKKFVLGNLGYIAGVKLDSNDQKTLNEKDFIFKWNSVPKKKRVFISFTSEDFDVAKKISSLLMENGYAVFTFLNKSNSSLDYNAEFTGKMFFEASSHLVIDTLKSRESIGVLFEAALLSKFNQKEFLNSIKVRWTLNKSPQDESILYVRGKRSGNNLSKPFYMIKVKEDNSWEVHASKRLPGNQLGVGRLIGKILNPPSVLAGNEEAPLPPPPSSFWKRDFTENPINPGKVFVHNLYGNVVNLVKVEPDGSWSVYELDPATHSYGRKVYQVRKPPKALRIETCTCL